MKRITKTLFVLLTITSISAITTSAFAERFWCHGGEALYSTCRMPPGGETVTSCGNGTYIPGNVTNRDWVDSRCAAINPDGDESDEADTGDAVGAHQ